jgi:hypothetical protein
MKLRVLSWVACVVAAAMGVAERSAACDRVVVAVVRQQAVGCVSQHVVPLAAATVSPLVVAPLAVVPVEITPVVVVESRVHRAATVRSVRAAAIRPIVVRQNRVRSVTRVRTVVR